MYVRRPLCLLAVLFVLVGCSSFRDTLPARSATEQVLLSTAADRAVEQLQARWMRGKAVYVDDARLEAYDRAYVVQRVREAVLDNGGRLAEGRADAAVVLEVASGGFSVDTGGFLLGIPSITLPVPFAPQGVTLPELALFKVESRVGKAKLLFSAVDAATGARAAPLPVAYGRAVRRFWWLFLLGPLECSDIPEEFR
jgi:hypothetical protein